MLFKSSKIGSAATPMGFCPGVDCGPYKCKETAADQSATEDISKRENTASSKKPNPSPAST